MVVFPPSKINVGLHVLSRRPDGFHNIRTLFFPLPFYDLLEVIPAAETRLHLSGLPVQGAVEENLCLQAYRMVKKDVPKLRDYAIYLHKNIPMGAGLGGGSADAAFMLRLLNQKARLGLSKAQLMGYAARLGSDCSFFIEDEPCLAEGRGERLQPMALPLLKKYALVLICPQVAVETAQAYRQIQPRSDQTDLATAIQQPVTTWAETITNDFEGPVFAQHPHLRQIKDTLYDKGAVYASLSGSGSALYGLFDHPVRAEDFRFPDADIRLWGPEEPSN